MLEQSEQNNKEEILLIDTEEIERYLLCISIDKAIECIDKIEEKLQF